MKECNSASTPTESILKLEKETKKKRWTPRFSSRLLALSYIYVTTGQIFFFIGLVSTFMNDPRRTHIPATRTILRYFRGNELWSFVSEICKECNTIKVHA